MIDPNSNPEPEYYTVEDFELGKCAMCQKEINIAGEILIHIAICLDCSRMIKSYEDETSH